MIDVVIIDEDKSFTIDKETVFKKYNTSIANLSQICPVSSINQRICIHNNEFVTDSKHLLFNFQNATDYFGNDYKEPEIKYIKSKLHSKFMDISRYNGSLYHVDISLIIIHAHFPTMMWEGFTRILSPLFEYFILTPLLFENYNYLFVVMLPDDKTLSNFHHIFIEPFTNFDAILDYISLLNSNYNDLIGLTKKWNKTRNDYNPYEWLNYSHRKLLHQSANNNSMFCFKEIYFCGLKSKGLPSIIEHEKDNSNEVPLSRDISRFLKWYYIRHKYNIRRTEVDTYGENTIVNVLLINRNESNPKRKNRIWLNINEFVSDCNRYINETLQIKLSCQVIYFENNTMTIKDTISALTNTDVLIGYHGSGLTNAIFLREYKSLLIELLPYKLPYFKTKIMSWIFKFIPIRHITLQLKKHENKQQAHMNIFNSPFKIEFTRILPILLWNTKNNFNGFNDTLPQYLLDNGYKTYNKYYYNQSLLYPL